MKLICLLHCVYALTDYYSSVEELDRAKEVSFQEEYGPKPIKEVNDNSYPIPVASIAIHGGYIEIQSSIIAKDLYLALPSNIRENSAYYTFGSNITSKQSIQVNSDRCIRSVCCRLVDGEENRGFVKDSCEKEAKKKVIDNCPKNDMCPISAAHITSTRFSTPTLLEVVKNRFVVSWHGFSSRKTVDNEIIDVIFGGQYKNSEKVAKKFVELTQGEYIAVFCKDKDDCHKVGTDIRAHVPGLEGVHPKNVVNLGRFGAGLHIEMSNKFRTNNGGHDELLKAVISTLPQKEQGDLKPKCKYSIWYSMNTYHPLIILSQLFQGKQAP